MFTQLHTLLTSDEWFGVSLEIEILKGLGEKPKTFKDSFKKIKRIAKFK